MSKISAASEVTSFHLCVQLLTSLASSRMEGRENIAAAVRNAVAEARTAARRNSEAAASAATTGHTGTQAGPAGSAPSASFGPAAAKGQECVQTGISIRVNLFRL
jgi:hypothetical protein